MRSLLLSASLLFTGCLAALDGGFPCTKASDCSGGYCVDGSCGEASNFCPSGVMYSATAGRRAGECASYVAPDLTVGGDGEVETRDATPQGDQGGDGAATVDLAGSPDLAKGADGGLCGNGVLDPGETCDPKDPKNPCPTIKDCDDGEACTKDLLAGTGCMVVCAHTFQGFEDGKPCSETSGGATVTGTCYKHACCTGCWTGSYCQYSQSVTSCGLAGQTCADCTKATPAACNEAACGGDGKCGTKAIKDGAVCTGGVCLGGACCKGCLDAAGKCVAGDEGDACGSGGGRCASCSEGGCGLVGDLHRCLGCEPKCDGKECGDDGCGGQCPSKCGANQKCDTAAGKCLCLGSSEDTSALCSDGVDNNCNGKTDCADSACGGKRCSLSGGQFCDGGACKSGCLIGGAVVAIGAVNPASPCMLCNPQINDQDWTPASDGATCPAGKCLQGKCCEGCVSAEGACLDGATNAACGKGGTDCAVCEATKECKDGVCGCTTEDTDSRCSDGLDNNCNNNIDCADTTCNAKGCGADGKVCADFKCACPSGTVENTDVLCSDKKDNNCDGKVDCDDTGCDGHACGANGLLCKGGKCVCPGAAENDNTLCGDGVDNDCNGAVDCKETSSCNAKRCALAMKFCDGGACAQGCVISGVFYGTGKTNPGNECQVCDPTKNDGGWTTVAAGTSCLSGAGKCYYGTCRCTSCGAKPCVDPTPCITSSNAIGTCRGSACCTTCWTGSRCLPTSSTTSYPSIVYCGLSGADCKSCLDGMKQPDCKQTCESGSCKSGNAVAWAFCGANCSGSSAGSMQYHYCDGKGACKWNEDRWCNNGCTASSPYSYCK